MLDAVRNRILDFALALGKIAPDAGEGQAQVEVQRVTQIFNMTIHGSVGVVGTANNAIVNVTTNDWAALAQFLATNGAAADDIDDLRDAVTEEPQPETGRWGPRVSTWIGKMMGKAADGTWQVGPGAAGNLLAQAIAAYYAGRGRPPLAPRRTRSRQPLDVKTLAMSLPSSAYQRSVGAKARMPRSAAGPRRRTSTTEHHDERGLCAPDGGFQAEVKQLLELVCST